MRYLHRLLLFLLICSSSCLAYEFNRVPAGLITGTRLSFVSTSAIKIGVGYGEIMGSYWEINPTDTLVTTGYSLTGLTTTTNGVVQYIYIDRANSSLPGVTLKNTTTAPTWSNDYMGWYNGLDRCIGALWVEPSGVLRSFFCADDRTYTWPTTAVTSFSKTLPSSYDVWTLFDISDYLPATTSEGIVETDAWIAGVTWHNCRVGISSENSSQYVGDGVLRAKIATYVPFERSAARKVKWMAYAATNSGGTLTTTGNLYVRISGYRIDR